MVNTFSPGRRYSPHYRFHGALYQVRQLELIFELLQPYAQRKRQIVRDVLKLWQTNGDYFEAGRYIATLSEETAQKMERKYPGFIPKTDSHGGTATPQRVRCQ